MKLQQVTVDGVNYLIDKDAKIKEGDWYYNYHAINSSKSSAIEKASKNVEINYANNMSYNNDTKFLRDNYHKVIAVEYPNTLEGVPQYNVPDEVLSAKEIFDNKAAFNKWLLELTENEKSLIIDMINDGADKALYTEEDMGNLWQYIIDKAKLILLGSPGNMDSFEDYIKSLNKSK